MLKGFAEYFLHHINKRFGVFDTKCICREVTFIYELVGDEKIAAVECMTFKSKLSQSSKVSIYY